MTSRPWLPGALLLLSTVPSLAQSAVSPRTPDQTSPASGAPNIVQPGAPGHQSRSLPLATAASATAIRTPSAADVAFMQGMIMHHNQAVEMTALLKSRSQNPEVENIGQRINISQTDEMRFMKQWLTDRGLAIPASMDMSQMPGMDHSQMPGMDHSQMPGMDHSQMPGMDHSQMPGMDHSQMPGMDHSQMPGMDHSQMPGMDHSQMPGMDHSQMPGMDMGHSNQKMAAMDSMPPMPGMLTPAQMDALRSASGPAFDHLFLTGMIQHHTGALTMVKSLLANPGAAQDPVLFDFASDVDNTQLAEIDFMKAMLQKEKP